jgi:diaminopimelate epimerase
MDSYAHPLYTPIMTDKTHINFPFMKMHGLGNDFVVIDARRKDFPASDTVIKSIADRNRGVGFDQLAIIDKSEADAHLIFYNADGSTSSACGNATRCIARYLMEESGKPELSLTTNHGVLQARDVGDGYTSVNMGTPGINWNEIPLANEADTLHLPIQGDPVATNMGNPHCTFFVADAESIDLHTRAAPIEHHPLFPQRTNVQFASLTGKNHLRMRVWERGVGVTLASGSSSCAAVVAAARRGLTGSKVQIDLDGGRLAVDWRQEGVWLTGPTMHVFSGTFTAEFLESTK